MRKRLLPLGIKNPTKTELPALIALEAIGQPWFGESHLSDLIAIALVSRLLAKEGSYIHMIAGELMSFIDGGDLKLDDVRPVVIDMLAWLRVQPNGRVQAAIDTLLRQNSALPPNQQPNATS
jgi:hypothetical protein